MGCLPGPQLSPPGNELQSGRVYSNNGPVSRSSGALHEKSSFWALRLLLCVGSGTTRCPNLTKFPDDFCRPYSRWHARRRLYRVSRYQAGIHGR